MLAACPTAATIKVMPHTEMIAAIDAVPCDAANNNAKPTSSDPAGSANHEALG